MYWRHAAGSADAANLNSGGRCVAEGGFIKVKLSTSTHPVGRLPETDSRELPNHACAEDTVNNCSKAVRCAASSCPQARPPPASPHAPPPPARRYNTINRAEDCCNACREIRWLGVMPNGGDGDNVNNPCLAWQVRRRPRPWPRRAYHSPPAPPFASSYPPPTVAVPRQIVDGKCRILRKEWFTTKYGSAGLRRER